MSKQKDSGALVALDKAVHRWDFNNSVVKMAELGKQWSKMTEKVARELYLAKENLTNQKGQRRNPDAPDYIQYTWGDYCETIGLSRQVADFWIKKFIPRELSPTGKDVLQLKPQMKIEETTAARAAKTARIQEVLHTGEKPKNWTDEEEAEYRKIMRNAHFSEMAEKYNAPTYYKANDFFSESLKKIKDITNFKLENSVYIQAQYKIFRYIEEYLNAFEDSETQARAAFNIALKARNLANEYAEKNFQIKNAQFEEEKNGN